MRLIVAKFVRLEMPGRYNVHRESACALVASPTGHCKRGTEPWLLHGINK